MLPINIRLTDSRVMFLMIISKEVSNCGQTIPRRKCPEGPLRWDIWATWATWATWGCAMTVLRAPMEEINGAPSE